MLGLLVGAAGCAHAATPTETADRVMRSIYDGDVPRTQQAFEQNVRPAVTPSSVNALTQRMRTIGNYEFVREVSTMEDHRYDFEAQFDRGSMLVQMRLDAAGNVAAFHVVPNEL